MAGTINESGIAGAAGIREKGGDIFPPTKKTRRRLEADGYTPELCPKCEGWGYFELEDNLGNTILTPCEYCNGDRVVLIRKRKELLNYTEGHQ